MGPTPSPSAAVQRDGFTALHSAAKCGNRPIVRKLLDANADIDAQDDINRCAFSFGIGGLTAESCRLPCSQAPLHWAAFHGDTGTIEELLMSGASVAIYNRFG
jgi:ankyrin repeat protein